MKYWRGYLTAAIFAGLTLALQQFAKNHSDMLDMFYPYMTRIVQDILVGWSGGFNFCLWQVLAGLLVVILIATIVLMVILKWNFFQWLGWVLACVSIGFCLHTGVYGLNTHCSPLAEDIRLNVTEFTVTELVNATTYYRDKANEYSRQIPRDAEGNPQLPSFEEMAAQAGEGFKTLTYERSFSVLGGDTSPVKKLGLSDMYTSMGIAGMTMPLTGEAAVNPEIPGISIPFTMCHEMAHRMCISQERDANLAAFLTCDIESLQMRALKGNLKGKCRFSDTRLSTDEYQGTFHHSSSENPVHLPVIQGYTVFDRGIYFRERHRLMTGSGYGDCH